VSVFAVCYYAAWLVWLNDVALVSVSVIVVHCPSQLVLGLVSSTVG